MYYTYRCGNVQGTAGASCHGNLIPISGLTRFSDVSANVIFLFYFTRGLTCLSRPDQKEINKERNIILCRRFTIHCSLFTAYYMYSLLE
jgi:hypothetical protein